MRGCAHCGGEPSTGILVSEMLTLVLICPDWTFEMLRMIVGPGC
jgi:hypothetical protein